MSYQVMMLGQVVGSVIGLVALAITDSGKGFLAVSAIGVTLYGVFGWFFLI